jgi:hypothetical protein
MAKFPSVGRRILLAGGFSIAIAAAPAAAFVLQSAAPAASTVACPAGEVEDIYIGECVPEMAPNTPGGNYPTPTGTGITNSTPGDPNSVPEVQGIPCTGANTGQCIGLQEEQVPSVQPRSSISSSP